MDEKNDVNAVKKLTLYYVNSNKNFKAGIRLKNCMSSTKDVNSIYNQEEAVILIKLTFYLAL